MTELLFVLALLGVAASVLRSREQQARIALLGSYLGKYQIERQMETLTDGYLRWLGEEGAERRAQIHGVLAGTEQSLAADTTPVEGPGWPEPRSYPVRHCLLVVLNEEWEHHRFAVRDLDRLSSG